MPTRPFPSCFSFLNLTATPEIYTLSLHDALPICSKRSGNSEHREQLDQAEATPTGSLHLALLPLLGISLVEDRKSTRLNSSHRCISYAVFCLKKKTRP